MFTIDSNQTIRVSKGDDFYFPLFVNYGNSSTDIMRYVFTGKNAIVDSSSQLLTATLDSWTFVNKIPTSSVAGIFQFIYNGTNWTLGGTAVTLSEYGITVTGTPQTNDFIKINYSTGDGCEVYFKMYFLNNTDDPIFTKTFTSKDDLWITELSTLPVNGDIKIKINNTDTTLVKDKDTGEYLTFGELWDGQYKYEIDGKILDKLQGSSEYLDKTLLNRHDIWIIDDDYSDRLWGD